MNRRAELDAAPDLWTAIEPLIDAARVDARHLAATVDPTLTEIEAKYRKGEAEHGRDWTAFSPDDFDRMIAEELTDLIAYCAMREALYPTVAPFLSDRDPGDEQAWC